MNITGVETHVILQEEEEFEDQYQPFEPVRPFLFIR